MQIIVSINLALVAVQACSAGFFLSGYGRAAGVHGVAARALVAGVLVQMVTATVLWRQGRVPAAVARSSAALLVVVMIQVVLGHRAQYWLHVPIGVALFAGLARQLERRRAASYKDGQATAA
jgi:hypothetical protein